MTSGSWASSKFTYPAVSYIFKITKRVTRFAQLRTMSVSLTKKSVVYPYYVGIYDSLEQLVKAINSAKGTYSHRMLEPLKNRKGSSIIRRSVTDRKYILRISTKKSDVYSASTKQVKNDLLQRLMRVSVTLQPAALLCFLGPCPTRCTSRQTYASLR